MFIASSVFAQAAQTQAVALGLPDVRRIFVPHPIQDATDDEMRAKADAIVEDFSNKLEKSLNEAKNAPPHKKGMKGYSA